VAVVQQVAAIDVGSNATRLLIAGVSSTGLCLRNEHHRYAVRLGADVFAKGRISTTKTRALLRSFAHIRGRLSEAGVRAYRAVATSAMRDAVNGAAVAQKVYEHSGLSLQIISGAQESLLSRAALLRSVGSASPDTLLLDLGGGSLELDRAGDPPGQGRSLPIGSVRLLEALPLLRQPLEGKLFDEARAQVHRLVCQQVQTPMPASTALGTGGNLDALLRLLPAPGDALGSIPTLDLPRLLPFVQQVARLSLRARQRTFGLRPDRADLIVPAALIILELVDLFAVKRLVVPGTGLRDALVHNVLVPSEPGSMVRRLLGRHSDARRTADQAGLLATQLFELTTPLHRLHPTALQPLHSALYAWYFGALLQPRHAARHGQYVLRELDNPYLDKRARSVALYAVGAQAVATPPPFSATESGLAADAPSAAVLAGLLRVAIALAPQGRRTTKLDVDLLQDPIVVRADLATPLRAELVAPLATALRRRLVVR
jgi:exopolyphosphatase/guanosine-5'-triphosphate,3'-diphosphate pyrophosphatase